MPNSHSISPETWAHARESIIFFFSRRHGRANAEDLAQETLLAVWKREDYTFEKDEDFLRVCYGFANRILLQGYRQSSKHDGGPLDPGMSAPLDATGGLKGTEIGVFLDEVIQIGKAKLREQDWRIIEQAAAANGSGAPVQTENANNFRVQLHRVRKKLAVMTGWRQE